MKNLEKLVDNTFRFQPAGGQGGCGYLCSDPKIAGQFMDFSRDWVPRFEPEDIATKEIVVRENLDKLANTRGEIQYDFRAIYEIKGRFSCFTNTDLWSEFESSTKIFLLEYYGSISSTEAVVNEHLIVHPDSIRPNDRSVTKISYLFTN